MKTAIVTGASGNLGKAVAGKFLANGFHVAGTILRHKAEQDELANFETRIVDLTKENEAGQFVSSIVEKHGGIDVAVLTVGGFAAGHLKDTSIADIRNQVMLNFETAYNIARPVFLQMKQQQSGRIFFIGSKPGFHPRNGKSMLAYTLAKSLLFALAEMLNEEAKGTDVVTAMVIPSTIDTPENRQSMPEAHVENWVQAEDIAEVIYFHCTGAGRQLREPVLKVYGNA